MKEYFNYHRHTSSSNIITMDSSVTNNDYAKRSIELGHKWLSSCEHSGPINFVDAYMTAKENKLKYIHVGEFYFVQDRIQEHTNIIYKEGYLEGNDTIKKKQTTKDKANYHLILVAKTQRAMEEINYIMSEANENGYYYRPRIDFELLKKLPKGEVYCTTACVGGPLKLYPSKESMSILMQLMDIFGENFFLEVQPHHTPKQEVYNKILLKIANDHNIKIIAGTDSHMIYEQQYMDREYLLHSKGIVYEDESGWFMDYPDRDTLVDRFRKQGILTEEQIQASIDNTLLLTNTDEIYIDTKMKVPTMFPDKTREWRVSYFKKLILDNWNIYKKKIDKTQWNRYINEILLEYDIVEETKMEDYFISNYHIINKGIENGGILTRTGRGSGASFFINMLLGFTTIDRLKSKLPMLPHRFMSASRIIEENSAPDIDFNIYNREAFLKAQDEIFGEHSNYFMVAWGTLGVKSSFKMLCRAKNIPIEIADEISKIISAWEFDKKHNEDVLLEDYVKDENHRKLIEESKIYNGVIDSMSAHPCATCLSNEDLRRKFGLLRTPNGDLVVNITGAQAEKLGYLKNDFLIVDVVDLNDRLYKRVGMEYIGAEDLYVEVEKYDGIWKLFEKGYTLCLNQMETTGTTQKMMRYKPRNRYEASNCVGAIRPGFASNYQAYESRQIFEYGIPFIDNLLKGEFLESAFMLYQEQQMLLLQIIGIKMDRIVATIKAISKKKLDVIEAVGGDFKSKLFTLCMENGETDEEKVRDVINKLWKIFVDSAKYMFNTPHAQSTATDCLHTAYIKYRFPLEFYEVALEKYSNQKDTIKVAGLKDEAFRYKGINVVPMRYGQDNRSFKAITKDNTISQSLLGIKGINSQTAEIIYQIGQEYPNIEFYDLYLIMKSRGLSKTHICNMLKIDFFNNLINKRKGLWLVENFDTLNKKQVNKDKVFDIYEQVKDYIPSDFNIMSMYDMIKAMSIKETAKLFKIYEGTEGTVSPLPKIIFDIINVTKSDTLEEYYWEYSLSGTVAVVNKEVIMGTVVKYNPKTNKIVFKNLETGVESWMAINDTGLHVKEKNIIFIESYTTRKYRGRDYWTINRGVNLSELYK